MILLVGPPIGTLFSSASMPFTLKPSYHLKSFQLFKKRKRTISKTSGEVIVSGVKRCRLIYDEDDGTNGNAKRTVTRCSASNVDGTLAECTSFNDAVTKSGALDASQLYATAAESFDHSHYTVMTSPQESVSKNNPSKIWRKRKRYNNNDMFLISKKKLKTNSDKIIIKKSKVQNSKGSRTKGLCYVL